MPDARARLSGLRIPAIAAPMFLASGVDLVAETCRAGMIGSFPALNPRSSEELAAWTDELGERLAGEPNAAPFAVNLIVHHSNPRLEADLGVLVARRVPLVITSLGAVRDVVDAVHAYGGLVFHDVISVRHAEKALAAGVDGLIAVCAGAGGHAGTLSPFALVPELRGLFAGVIALGGAISTGAHIAAAQLLGADFAYMGTRFLATRESMIAEDYKAMIVASRSADIVYTAEVSGVPANFLAPSLAKAGIHPGGSGKDRGLDVGSEVKAWKSVWSAGHGVGTISDIPTVAELCARLAAEYDAALGFAADLKLRD